MGKFGQPKLVKSPRSWSGRNPGHLYPSPGRLYPIPSWGTARPPQGQATPAHLRYKKQGAAPRVAFVCQSYQTSFS